MAAIVGCAVCGAAAAATLCLAFSLATRLSIARLSAHGKWGFVDVQQAGEQRCNWSIFAVTNHDLLEHYTSLQLCYFVYMTELKVCECVKTGASVCSGSTFAGCSVVLLGHSLLGQHLLRHLLRHLHHLLPLLLAACHYRRRHHRRHQLLRQWLWASWWLVLVLLLLFLLHQVHQGPGREDNMTQAHTQRQGARLVSNTECDCKVLEQLGATRTMSAASIPSSAKTCPTMASSSSSSPSSSITSSIVSFIISWAGTRAEFASCQHRTVEGSVYAMRAHKYNAHTCTHTCTHTHTCVISMRSFSCANLRMMRCMAGMFIFLFIFTIA